MTVVNFKKYTLLAILSGMAFLVSCGQHSPEVNELKFIPGQVLDKGKLPDQIERNETYTFLDYDQDLIPDRFDDDIDGDDVPNLIDQYPFDKSRSGLDRDKDGIPDFVDFDAFGTCPHSSARQRVLFKTKKIAVINGGGEFECEELDFIFRELNKLSSYNQLKVVVARSSESRPNGNFSDYDSHWKTLSLYPTEQTLAQFKASFLHELGHVDAANRPETFRQFQVLYEKWNHFSPSEYGKSSAEEGFAEWYLLFKAQKGQGEIAMDRFLPLDELDSQKIKIIETFFY